MELEIIKNDDNYNKVKRLFANNNFNVTNLLKEDCFRKILKEHINFPTLEKQNIKFERNQNIKGFESLIGMSYDYGMRFLYSHKLNKNIDSALFDSIGFKIENNKEKLLNHYDKLSKTNKVKALIDLAFKLSLNETKFRCGKDLDFNNYPDFKINYVYKEIEQLLKISFSQIEKKINKIDYNPVFGNERLKADGDIIINNTLIDFKVVSSLNGFHEHLEQLIVYYILSKQIQMKYKYDFNIKNIQIFYPRYNIYPEFKISDLISNESVKKIMAVLP